MPSKFEQEATQRLRRVETKITQMAVAMGIRTESQKPQFDCLEGRVDLPSPHSSLKEIIDSIPENWQSPVGVFIGDQRMATVIRKDPGAG